MSQSLVGAHHHAYRVSVAEGAVTYWNPHLHIPSQRAISVLAAGVNARETTDTLVRYHQGLSLLVYMKVPDTLVKVNCHRASFDTGAVNALEAEVGDIDRRIEVVDPDASLIRVPQTEVSPPSREEVFGMFGTLHFTGATAGALPKVYHNHAGSTLG